MSRGRQSYRYMMLSWFLVLIHLLQGESLRHPSTCASTSRTRRSLGIASGLLSAYKAKNGPYMKRKALHVVEHLIDCQSHQQLAQVMGEQYCLHPPNMFYSIVKGFFQQVSSIGFLIIAYYIFKRSSKGGIKEWDMINADDEEELDFDKVSIRRSVPSNRQRSTEREVCPMCSGTGKLSGGRQCSLCDGAGVFERVKTYSLPTANEKNRYIDGEYDDDR
jgi:hypothetical protein